MSDKRDPLVRVEELFAFLQGDIPEGYQIEPEAVPRLEPDQAWTVIWFLANMYWQVPDYIARCDVCGSLFNTGSGGECLDWGDDPYHVCDECCYDPVVVAKREAGDKTEEPTP